MPNASFRIQINWQNRTVIEEAKIPDAPDGDFLPVFFCLTDNAVFQKIADNAIRISAGQCFYDLVLGSEQAIVSTISNIGDMTYSSSETFANDFMADLLNIA